MYQIIKNKLATAAIWQYQYNFLNEGLYQLRSFNPIRSWPVIDVRDLFDEDSNSLDDYNKKINLVWDAIQNYGRSVVCCVAGISRSNAIALGVLVRHFDMDFYDANELIKMKVPGSNISPGHIVKLKKMFKVTSP